MNEHEKMTIWDNSTLPLISPFVLADLVDLLFPSSSAFGNVCPLVRLPRSGDFSLIAIKTYRINL